MGLLSWSHGQVRDWRVARVNKEHRRNVGVIGLLVELSEYVRSQSLSPDEDLKRKAAEQA